MNDIIVDTNTSIPETLNGDFVSDDAEFQHQEHLIVCVKGNLIQFPTIGAGIKLYMDSNADNLTIKKAIREALSGDGYIIEDVSFNDANEINVIAYRIR